MPRVEIKLEPVRDWEEAAWEDWSSALGAFLAESGRSIRNTLRFPGYQVLEIAGSESPAEVVLSASERLVLLEGLRLDGSLEQGIIRFVLRFAREMGAQSFVAPVCSPQEEDFWRALGARFHPDPVGLTGEVERGLVDVQPLSGTSLLITYAGKPAVCLEPIACTAHSPGPVSLAQRRLEKHFGGQPLGFASRISSFCPWDVRKSQWDDLLSYSRLKSYEILAELVFGRKDER
ncbi:Hypothetical protein DEACI_3749 [Acididesulfobacillus acetoxydans]|uniref:Uncharacterized protein n=1 Tax=Acididesulfobacillus acetoxydans TaxID=1561005 RepID=A0A8S0XCX8_9FIRM|nr:hypothetical protein [Acididesulfobacillus acetoxydans]CAA7602926.1 Hypothetical protein DEACI_3749 [Acididesulfobacillus acetoxydans]CEJ05808.1 Hypothetical protein DEACI_0228 [Acididesulfobacillus acetoxydans]